jgi:hypothetical protein
LAEDVASNKYVIFVHGWSDHDKSMLSFAKLIKKLFPNRAIRALMVDYVSLDDRVHFYDLVDAFENAWQAQGLSDIGCKVDLVVHSTAALVVRAWLCRYFHIDNFPIKRILMLAPANFGSHIAHLGQNFVGRLFKGHNPNHFFEVGERLLMGLELASPFSWDLAHKDLLLKESPFRIGKILCTVLIGADSYGGLSSVLDLPASDGVILHAGSHLQATKISLNLMEASPSFQIEKSRSYYAYRVLEGLNHSSILEADKFKAALVDIVYRAMTINDNAFKAWVDISRSSIPGGDDFQQCLVRVVDQYGDPVNGYRISLASSKNKEAFYARLEHNWLKYYHENLWDPSRCCLYLNKSVIAEYLLKSSRAIKFNLQVFPQYVNRKDVGYPAYDQAHHHAIVLPKDIFAELFQSGHNMMWEITVPRIQGKDICRMRTYASVVRGSALQEVV